MSQEDRFLKNIVNDIFKLLPMKEDNLKGIDNQLAVYIEDVIINMKGAAKEYPNLAQDKYYMYAINKLQALATESVSFAFYRKTIFDTLATIKRLSRDFEVRQDGK